MISRELVYKILIVAGTFLMPIHAWSSVPVKAVEIKLGAEAVVGGGTVLLGDVATIYAKSLRDFNTLSNLVISSFSADGSEIRLPQAYIENRIREALPEGTDFRLSAPASVVFRQEKLGVTPVEFVAELKRKAKAEGKIPEWAEAEVELLSGQEQLKLRLNGLRIDPATQMARWRGDVTFRVSGKNGEGAGWIKARVRWFTDAWVAKRNLSILAALSPADFAKERVEVTNVREDVLTGDDLASLLGNSRAKRSLAAGTALTAGMVERSPDARTGQQVQVVFISESGIRVSTEGAMIGNGSVGGEARAKLRNSRKIVTGKLVSSGQMEVSL